MTPQRIMVLDALHSVDTHISAEEIYAQVKAKYPYANICTVYRTLDLLKELGLVNEIDLGDGRVRYHPAEKGNHHHLICNNCGKIIDLPESALVKLTEALAQNYKFKAEVKHMAVFGVCAECQK